MYAIIYWQNPCKLPTSFRCIKAFMHAFSGMFSRTCLEGISFKFFVCFIFNVSLGSVPKRKNFDIRCNTRVGSGGLFTSNRLSNDHMKWWLEHNLLFNYVLGSPEGQKTAKIGSRVDKSCYCVFLGHPLVPTLLLHYYAFLSWCKCEHEQA